MGRPRGIRRSDPDYKQAINAKANIIAVVNSIEPFHRVPIQLKILTPVGTAISMVVMVNTEFATGPRPTVNIWWLQTAQPMMPITIPENTIKGVAKQGLPRERRQNLRDNTHRRQDQNVDFGMSKDPEKVLPENRIATFGRDEEMSSKVSVHGQFDWAARDDREG
ncbi:MAG: hypothetical protein CM1200mP27_13430 [Chloroflexota bacterium]|nr:MAG: hypothetical protein CM1200mP27_13430 [Chloroflexota bacterium]